MRSRFLLQDLLMQLLSRAERLETLLLPWLLLPLVQSQDHSLMHRWTMRSRSLAEPLTPLQLVLHQLPPPSLPTPPPLQLLPLTSLPQLAASQISLPQL